MSTLFLVLDFGCFASDPYASNKFLEGQMNETASNVSVFHYVDTTLIVFMLGGIAHILIRVGAMSAKIDAMWKWYQEHVK